MQLSQDAYGQQILAEYHGQMPTAEIIERGDRYIDTGSEPGTYFRAPQRWARDERGLVQLAKGRTLDIGCGAGRHSLYLQSRGVAVVGIDSSSGAIRVCRLRGVRQALVRPIAEVGRFKSQSFDTVLMLGNNFGLLGSARRAPVLLRKLDRITSPDARILAATRNPYRTTDANHLDYHRLNRKRGRMAGQIRMRIRFGRAMGPWFDYLFVSPREMTTLLRNTPWEVEKFVGASKAQYFAVLRKRRAR